MICVKCGGKTTVTKSRSDKSKAETYREHTCNKCRHLYWTKESEFPEDEARKKYSELTIIERLKREFSL